MSLASHCLCGCFVNGNSYANRRFIIQHLHFVDFVDIRKLNGAFKSVQTYIFHTSEPLYLKRSKSDKGLNKSCFLELGFHFFETTLIRGHFKILSKYQALRFLINHALDA